MRKSRWILISTISGILICGTVIMLATGLFTSTGMTASQAKPVSVPEQLPAATPSLLREAQARPPAPNAPAAPRAAPAAPAPKATSSPRRVETTEYDSWAVTCEDTTAGGAAKRSCVGSLRVRNQNQMLLNWEIGSNPDGRWVTAVHIPSALAAKQGDKTIGGPILVADGVDLKFGNGPARRLSFVSCGPRQCVAEATVDEGFVKEAVANANGKATITVHTGGGDVPFEVPIKGIDKAIASTRK